MALLGLSLFAGPAAARGDGPPANGPADGRRSEARAAVAALGGKAERSPLLRRVSAVRRAAPQPSAAAACPKRRGAAAAAQCRGGFVQTLGWRGWAQGLPPALGVQAQECPAGTMATLAEGHDDIVRCIPL